MFGPVTGAQKSVTETCHVVRAKIDVLEIRKESLLLHPEDAVVPCNWLAARLVDLWILLPIVSTIGPTTTFELLAAPGIAHLDHVKPRASRIHDASEDRIRVAIYDTIGLLGVASRTGTSAHYKISGIPSAHLLEHLVLRKMLVHVATPS